MSRLDRLDGRPNREVPRRVSCSLHSPFIRCTIWLPRVSEVAMAITKRQREVYDFISEFVAAKGYSPSFEEIGEALGLSSLATVHKHISNLESKGLLKRDYNRSRSIDVVPMRGIFKRTQKPEGGLPLLGRIAAGQPIEAVENPETISLGD